MATKILIVDNDRLITQQLQDALTEAGYETYVAADGMEGLQANRQIRPQLVLLDLVLPKIDGYRFCRYLREDPEFSAVPIVILSAMAPEALNEALEAGASATLMKEPMASLLPKLTKMIGHLLNSGKAAQVETPPQTTSKKEIMKELLEERTHFREILRVFPDGVMEIDSVQRILFANAGACELLNQKESAIVGKNFSDLFPPDLRLLLSVALNSTLLGEYPLIRETITFGGRILKLSFAFVSSAMNSGCVIVIQDITGDTQRIDEIHRENRQLQRIRQELERRLNAFQMIQRLSSQIEYPFGYPEVMKAILQLLPELIRMDAAATMIETATGLRIHIHLKEEAGESNVNVIRREMTERYSNLLGHPLDLIGVSHHFTGPSVSARNGPYVSFKSSLFVPLKTDSRTTGLIGCFSAIPGAFTSSEEQLVDALVNLTSNSVVNLKNLIDEERKKIQAMVESMADGVMMMDQNDEIVVINHAAKKMLRVSRKDDVISKKYFQETLGFYPHHLTKGMVQVPGSPATIQEEIKIFRKTLHSVVSPVFDSEGNPTGTVVVLRDITEQKESEERKNEFLSVISHELRTPLASIGGSLDLVLKNVVGQINQKQKRYLELARDSCQKLNVVIDDLLDLSKFEKGKMEIHMEPISIVKLVTEVTDKFQPVVMEKQIVLRLNRPPQDITIYGDYNRLMQVMNNLLSNAIKFTPTGGEIEVEIFIPKVTPPHIGVSVRDTGPGVPAEHVERVFDKFEQVRRSDERKVGGTGLGLSISRSIVEAHKGKIWVESKHGQGAKFIFLLPADKRYSSSPEIYAELAKSISQEETCAVLVSPDPANAYVLKGTLLDRGVQVMLAENAQEGLTLIRETKPQIVILDLDNEPSARNQLIEIVAHDPETKQIPILSFYRMGEEETIPFPYAMHVKKPIDMTQFLQTLTHALAKARGIDQRKKVLVVDDDPNLRMICREALEYQNYRVMEAADGTQALETLKRQQPDLILLDIMLPGIDGFQISQIIRSNISTSNIPIVFLTAKGHTEDKVKALKSGATDYLVKPFDSTELGARIETILERQEQELAASPTTKLPGSVSIEREINRLLQNKQIFALCYLDLDNLKAYNDVYGYAKADGVIKQTGDILRESVMRLGESSDFVGHIAGDDFILITAPERADRISTGIIERFDAIIPYFYNPEDRERGYIDTEDRYGIRRHFPIMSISIACLTNEDRQLEDHVQIATLAAEYKRIAKGIPGSVYVRNGVKVTL